MKLKALSHPDVIKIKYAQSDYKRSPIKSIFEALQRKKMADDMDPPIVFGMFSFNLMKATPEVVLCK